MSISAAPVLPGERDRLRGAIAVLCLLGLLAGLGALAVVLTSNREEDAAVVAPLTLVTGWAFVASGLVAWWRRPENRTGPLMAATGLLLFLGALARADGSLLFTIGVAGGVLAEGVFVHLLLAFPEGRLHSRLERVLVGAAYLDVSVVQLAMLAFMRYDNHHDCPCPENLLLLADNDAVHSGLMAGQRLAGIAIVVGIVVVLVRRWRPATRPMRRALTPVLAMGALAAVLTGVSLAVAQLSEATADLVSFAALGSMTLVPLAFLAGLVRARLARAAVGELVVKLGATPEPGRLRDALARTLGDPSLDVAYWIPESGSWADVEGRPVELPSPGAGRATTLVEHRGRRVAALVHDPSLMDDIALVDAACAAAGLALENERLQAELRARLEDLRASRARIVQAGDSERRRLERNLHDGAQQRLVSLSLILGLIESGAGGASARELAAGAREELAFALEELRELARGLHPAILNRGLEFALAAVAERSPVPVDVRVQPGERTSEQVEATAYYVVSEALTNVARYAQASSATVRVAREDDTLRVEVADDGVGGARISDGSGLQGLRDRVEAIGGRLDLDSPRGRGTRILALLPL